MGVGRSYEHDACHVNFMNEYAANSSEVCLVLTMLRLSVSLH